MYQYCVRYSETLGYRTFIVLFVNFVCNFVPYLFTSLYLRINQNLYQDLKGEYISHLDLPQKLIRIHSASSLRYSSEIGFLTIHPVGVNETLAGGFRPKMNVKFLKFLFVSLDKKEQSSPATALLLSIEE